MTGRARLQPVFIAQPFLDGIYSLTNLQRIIMKRLYAFLVGINTYPAPVSTLNGCIFDIDKVEKFLRGQFGEGELFIHRLENENATYANLVKGFREHLCRAGADDVAFFHFSGHGSEEPTAEEFLKLEPNGKDQTLVCFDSRPDGLHLADKELAALLHEVETQFPDGSEKASGPHLVVSLDCCHSGSGTRDLGDDPLFRTRNVPARGGDARPLASYLDGYYARQGEALHVPLSKHVLFSACESVQKAGDKPFGGIFTSSLMRALGSANGAINYADLFVRTRASAKRIGKNQTPQFETIGSFNPYTRFLSGEPLGDPDTYEVYHDAGSDAWYVKCGAIHGLPTQAEKPLEVEVRGPAPDKQVVAQATITRVGAQRSPLALPADAALEPKKTYQGVLHHLPAPPKYVWIHGDVAGVDLLKEHWDRSKNVLYVETRDGDEQPEVEVEAQDGAFIIRDVESRRKIHQEHLEEGPDQGAYTAKLAQLILQSLGRIARWERTVALENPDSRIENMFDFDVEVFEAGDRGPVSQGTFTGPEIKLYASKENTFWNADAKADLMGFKPVVKTSATQELYFYLLLLNNDYSIQCDEGEIVFRPGEHEGQAIFPLMKGMPDGIMGWGLNEDEQEATVYFKLFVTTEELDYIQLLQDGLGGSRATFGAFAPQKVFDAWASRTIRVTMVRQVDEVQAANEVSLAGGALRIRPHAGVRAKVNLGAAQTGTRSTDPANRFALFDDPAFQMMNFSSHRDLGAQNVVELSNLEIDDPAALFDDPLEIVLPGADDNDAMLLPIAFDGQNFVVIGDSAVEEGETVVRIRALPDVEPVLTDGGQAVNPFGEEPQDRSLFKALKMAFFKVALKQETDRINKLCWADFQEDGSVERRSESLNEKVAAADTILLAIHGIIGDTESIAAGLPHARDAEGRSLKDRFDLMLTYDYENLNTPIEETAQTLKRELALAGLTEDDGKHLTILAHSMGGLVSRWFIEQEEGNKVVDHLILAGTPNGGSKFGTIEQYRKFVSTALNLSINFITKQIPFAGTVLNVLKGAEEVTVTLGQMTPGSTFLNTLNSSDDPGIPYTILAGDITDYEVQGGGFKRLLEKATVGVGGIVYDDEPNDIAVSSRSIGAVGGVRQPAPQTLDVVCHHLNYFSSEAGLQTLGALPVTWAPALSA